MPAVPVVDPVKENPVLPGVGAGPLVPQQAPVIGPVKMPAIQPAGMGTTPPVSKDPANPNVWKG